MLDPKLFTPDERWTYDASDKYERPKARFEGAVAGQQGVVSIGDTRWLNSGASVRYRVWKYAQPAEAHAAFIENAPPAKPGKFARRTHGKVEAGDEARDVAETVVDEKGDPASYSRRIDIRFGAYLVAVVGTADMKAFGAPPSAGPRPWLCEEVFSKVLKAALKHWRARGVPGSRKME
jgi:hypothetical protein